VGASGAGKSSLVGALLGWHHPSAGRIVVDGQELDARRLQALRDVTAWVDPAVQLWNRSLLENLRYGTEALPSSFEPILAAADLHSVLVGMPDAMQTPLGEGGGAISGGEGQRVRFGRALARAGVRLVVLDEPFRGLDRDKRRLLLERARQHFAGATILCVTHDVRETLGFERVLVVDGGRIAEDGRPSELAETDSQYRTMLDAERRVHERLWEHPMWRRLRLEGGRLVERSPGTRGES
jgi:ATP-binding cassette subfamily B protein